MDQRQRTSRFGIFVILCACILRLFAGGTSLIWLETGRNVRFSLSERVYLPHARESPAPWLPEKEKPRFTGTQGAQVPLDNDCALSPDLASLIQKPLGWDLAGEEPRVLILHTHTTESYTKTGEAYLETADYRTLDENYNMLSIGDAVEEILMKQGIGVVHDRTVHDYPSYNGAYVHARETTERMLEQYPSICLVLDLHRDALEQGGKQLGLTAEIRGEKTAQLMLVVGTNVSRTSHKNWEENLSLALKLHVLLERQCPGIMRPLNLRGQRFNQDLSTGALLVEVGTAGNTREEALRAAEQLALAIGALAAGTE